MAIYDVEGKKGWDSLINPNLHGAQWIMQPDAGRRSGKHSRQLLGDGFPRYQSSTGEDGLSIVNLGGVLCGCRCALNGGVAFTCGLDARNVHDFRLIGKAASTCP
jgi:hypothetical protein